MVGHLCVVFLLQHYVGSISSGLPENPPRAGFQSHQRLTAALYFCGSKISGSLHFEWPSVREKGNPCNVFFVPFNLAKNDHVLKTELGEVSMAGYPAKHAPKTWEIDFGWPLLASST